jgi:endogenous inhibitor of DNA gyrase (YacG/DUF329 family)
MEHRCPICHKTISISTKEPAEIGPFFPFCSRRCKLLDLGAWLEAEYRIASESQTNESDKSSDETHPYSEEE